MADTFQVLPVRFQFLASETVLFPPGGSSNIVRGAFGSIFRRLVCVPQCRGPGTCEIREICPYARIFAPRLSGRGPSGLSDWPRPFVFRAHHLDGRTVGPGESFHFDLHLFDLREPSFAHFVHTFKQLAYDGLGPGRGRAALTCVELLGADGRPRGQLYGEEKFLVPDPLPHLVLDLSPAPAPVRRLLVRFATPTELKSGKTLAPRPEFAVLFARIRDRLSTLRALYGPGPLAIDFKAMGERAALVRMARSEIRRVRVTRRSARTGQVHPIGGFTGEVEYEGELAGFLPYLRAAFWTGVGRQTVWGKGVIETVVLQAEN
jgi:hypothetical protein